MADSDPAQLGRIFINYRRADTDYQASWLYEHVGARFGRAQVFKDVDNIKPGDDFVEILSEAVGECDVLLALIGTAWVNAADHSGGRRLDDPDDYVRIEIEAALERNVRVIPLLIGEAEMPARGELPASLAPLIRRHAIRLSPHRFQDDSEPVLAQIESTLADQADRRATKRLEQERTEAEESERERFAKEEQERLRQEAERIDAERLEAESQEASRVEQVRIEEARLEKERLENERLLRDQQKARNEAERSEAKRGHEDQLKYADDVAVRRMPVPPLLTLIGGLLSLGALGADLDGPGFVATLFLSVGAIWSAGTVLVRPTRTRVALCCLSAASLVGWNAVFPVIDALEGDSAVNVWTWLSQATAVAALMAVLSFTVFQRGPTGSFERQPNPASRLRSAAALAGMVIIVAGSYVPDYNYYSDGSRANFWNSWNTFFPNMVLGLTALALTAGVAALSSGGRNVLWLALVATTVDFWLIFTPSELVQEDYSAGLGWWLMLVGAIVALASSWLAWSSADRTSEVGTPAISR